MEASFCCMQGQVAKLWWQGTIQKFIESISQIVAA